MELEKLRRLILDVLPNLEPRIDWQQKRQKLEIPLLPSGGLVFKAVEDQLDSLICAYVGAHWWYWRLTRNRVLGSLTTGYIVVPNARVAVWRRGYLLELDNMGICPDS